MELPLLTCNILTYKRPWYALLTMMRMVEYLRYEGKRRFVVIDGGSPDWHLKMYEDALRYQDFKIVSVSGSVNQMMNQAAKESDSVWVTALDDFMLERSYNITPDVEFLELNADVGHLRYGKMNAWDTERHIYAELRGHGWYHYWVLDKERSDANYLWTMGFSLTHRRMWDAYGNLAPATPHEPGATELELNSRLRNNNGPTIAIPMRVGQASNEQPDLLHHIGHVRTDEYSKNDYQRRWGAT